MKKQLITVLGLAVLATPAFASKARLLALGEDIYGSFYINDNRNIFYNAAQVNNHKDYVTFEWGDTATQFESNATPRAEGGFYKSAGSLNYGVHLGSESVSSAGFRAASGAIAVQESNNVDVFVGGDAGVKWGANITYSKTNKNEANNAEQDAIRSRFGVIAGDLEVFANVNLANKAKVDAGGPLPAGDFKGKLGYQVGAIYNHNDYKLFADYRTLKGEANGTVAGPIGLKGDLESSQIQIGVGRANKLNDKSTLFTKIQYQNNKAENTTTSAIDFGGDWLGAGLVGCGLTTSIFCKEYSASFVPVTVGLEHEATSWLALRGSISQTIWGTEEDSTNERSFANSTKVNAGASLKFGEMSIDGLIGSGAGNSTDAGVVNTDNLMSRVSMTYKF